GASSGMWLLGPDLHQFTLAPQSWPWGPILAGSPKTSRAEFSAPRSDLDAPARLSHPPTLPGTLWEQRNSMTPRATRGLWPEGPRSTVISRSPLWPFSA